MELLHKDITGEIIGEAFEVYKQLGYGFLESVYQKAMKVELELRGLKAELESQRVQLRFLQRKPLSYTGKTMFSRFSDAKIDH